MDSIVQFLLSNALVATILALALTLAGRVWRHPGLLHMLWLIVLVKLVTPPVVTIPIHWSSETGAETQSALDETPSVAAIATDESSMPEHQPIPAAEGSLTRERRSLSTPPIMPREAPQLSSEPKMEVARISAIPWKEWLMVMWLTGSVNFYDIPGLLHGDEYRNYQSKTRIWHWKRVSEKDRDLSAADGNSTFEN